MKNNGNFPKHVSMGKRGIGMVRYGDIGLGWFNRLLVGVCVVLVLHVQPCRALRLSNRALVLKDQGK